MTPANGLEYFEYIEELSAFYLQKYNWKSHVGVGAFNIERMKTHGVPSVLVDEIINEINVKFVDIQMHLTAFNVRMKSFYICESVKDVQIIQIGSSDYLLVHAEDKNVFVYGMNHTV